MIAHLFSLLIPALGTQMAGIAVGTLGAAAIIGRAATGYLLTPGTDRRAVAALNCSVQLAGSVAFVLAAGDNAILLIAGVLLLGFGIGNGASLPPLVAQVEFAKDDVSRAVPVIIAIAQASSAFAPAVFGLLRDLAPTCALSACGNAPLLFVVAGILQALACISFLAGRR
jgi:hypothetical protein